MAAICVSERELWYAEGSLVNPTSSLFIEDVDNESDSELVE